MYDRAAWDWAGERQHLKARQIPSVMPTALNNQIVNGETTLDEHLEIDWAIFVKQEFAQAGKGPMARHFSRIQDDAFEERMPFLETLMIEIVSYLFPEADQHGGVIQDEVASLSAATPASRNLSGLRRSAISSSCSSAQVTTICTALE